MIIILILINTISVHLELCVSERPIFRLQRTTPFILGCFVGRTCKNNNRWYTKSYKLLCNFYSTYIIYGRSQQPRGLRHRPTAARVLRLWVRILTGTWMSFSCECCVLSGGKLTTRPNESYRLWCIVVCGLETSWMRRSQLALGRSTKKKNA